MSTCRADGVLLKPDRPAFPPNAFFLQHRGKGEVQLTATHIGAGKDRMGWSFCLSFAMGDDVELSAAELGLEAGSVGVAWRRSNLEPFQVAAGALQRFGPGKPPLSFAMQVILPPAPAVSNEGRSSELLVPLPAVSWPWVAACGSLERPC